MRLTAIHVHPVKSLRGYAVTSAAIDALGLADDRRFMVVDVENRFLTQRTLPRMALVETALDPTHLVLNAPGMGALRVARAEDGAPLRPVTIWQSRDVNAEDAGDAPAAWLSDFLKTPCRLVRVGRAFDRPVLKPGRALPDDRVGFADLFPFLVVSEASLKELNRRVGDAGGVALPMDRFRPNLVVGACAAFAEDTWTRFRIGTLTFRTGGPCARCAITTTDQRTGERGVEPLRTLATFRRDATDPAKVNFGQNVFHESKSGTLHVDDRIELLAAG